MTPSINEKLGAIWQEGLLGESEEPSTAGDELDAYLTGIADDLLDAYDVEDEDDAIDFVFDVADEMAEAGELPEFPDDDADDAAVAAWLSKAKAAGFEKRVAAEAVESAE